MQDARASGETSRHGGPRAAIAAGLCCAAAAAWLRLHGLADQLLVSDEWHALHAAGVSSYAEIFSRISPGATSIPMNAYTKLLLDGGALREVFLRAPSLLAGVALVALFPVLVRGIVPPRTALVGTLLLAVSPFLVFYSRYARPYSLVVLLTFVALVCAYRWGRSGRARDAALFVATGAAAAVLHPLELRSLFAPLGVLAAVRLAEHVRPAPGRAPRVAPGLPAIAVAGGIGALCTGGFLLPPLVRGGELVDIAGRGAANPAALAGSLEFLIGSASPAVLAALVGLTLLGLWRLASERALFAALVVGVAAVDVASVLASRPVDSRLPMVVARYLIPLLPVYALLAGHGSDALLRALEGRAALPRALSHALVAALPIALLLAGPLPRLFGARNDFTHHKAFQFEYGRSERETQRFTRYLMAVSGEIVPEIGVPSFYERLAGDERPGPVVEYPMAIGDRYLPYAVYQARHGRRVIGGFQPRAPPPGHETPPGNLNPEWPIGLALGPAADRGRVHLRNFVDVGDPVAIRRSGAAYLIVHPQMERKLSVRARPPVALADRMRLWREHFGEPVYADARMVAFAIGDGR